MAVNDNNECLFLLEVVQDFDMIEPMSSSILSHALSADCFIVSQSSDSLKVIKIESTETVARRMGTLLQAVLQKIKT